MAPDQARLMQRHYEENKRLRNIALDALPFLQQSCAGMSGSPDRAKLRSIIAQIIQFVPDDED